ncbi:MAG: hypothetical protein RL071_542 [Pseudomonadota bacterium]
MPEVAGGSPVVDTLARLVSWDTVSHRPLTALAGYLADRAEAAGMRVERFETAPGKINVVASAGPPSVDGLLLSGHMDVVPVEGQAWTSDPFVLTRRDDRLVARGACDMKGFIAAAVEACGALDLRALRRELVLVWTHDEEIGCHGSRALVDRLRAEQPDRQLPRAAIIGEPTDFRICRLHPGHTTFTIECLGRPAHSSRPSLGFNAIRLAAEVIAVVDGFAVALEGRRAHSSLLVTPYTVLNVGRIEGGAAVNIVPERCTLTVGMRPVPGALAGPLLAELEDRLAPLRARARAEGGDVRLQLLQSSEPLDTPACCGHADLLRPHADAPELVGVPFATDGGNLAQLGLEPLVFGPGSIDVAHRPDEHLREADLHRATAALTRIIEARCCA